MASDVKLSVDLEAGDVTSAAGELQKRIESIFSESAGKEVSAQFERIQIQMSRLYDKSVDLKKVIDANAGTAVINPEYEKISKAVDRLSQKLKDLDKQNQELEKRIADEKIVQVETKKFSKLGDEYDKLRTKIDEIINRQNKLIEVGRRVGQSESRVKSTKQYKSLNYDLAQISKRIREIRDARAKMVADGTAYTNTKEYGRLLNEQTKLNDKVKETSTLWADAVNAKRAYEKSGADSTAWEKTETGKKAINDLKDRNNQMSRLVHEAEMAGDKINESPLSAISGWQALISVINQGPSAIVQIADTVVRTLPPAFQVVYAVVKKLADFIINEFKSSFNLVKNTIQKGAVKSVQLLGTAAKSALSGVKKLVNLVGQLASSYVGGKIKGIAESIGSIGKSAKDSAPNLKQIGRMFLQYGIGARSLYRLINKLRTALFEGFADLALAYQPFNEAMSSIVTALDYLKNSFAAAFAPIIEFVAPAVSLFVNKMADAVQMVGQFIAALTGKEFVMALPVYKDYAESTKEGAAAAREQAKAEKQAKKMAEDEAKAQKKREKALKAVQRTIAGFDDVEILKEPSDTTQENLTAGINPDDYDFDVPTLERAMQIFKVGGPLQDGIQQFADLIKKAWLTADAYDLGQKVSRQLGDLLRAFNKSIPQIQEFTTKVARVIASFLAGFLSIGDTFKVLGQAIANVINTIFKTVEAFLTTFMNYDGFKNLGKAIYYTIVNALANINWETIYNVFRMLGIGIAQVLNETIARPDFWNWIFLTICNAITALLLQAANFITNLHWNEIGLAIASGINTAIENFPFELLSGTLANFVNGIFALLFNLITNTNWYELGLKIGMSIVNFFSNVNWDLVLNTIMAFIGGIFDGLQGIIDTIPFEELGTTIGLFIANAIERFPADKVLHAVATFINGIFTMLGNIRGDINWEEVGNKIGDDIMNFFRDINWEENGKNLGSFLQGIFDTLKGISEKIDFDEVAQDIVDFISGFFSEFDWQENADTILGLLNRLLSAFMNGVMGVKWEEIIDNIREYLATSPEVEKFLSNVWATIWNIANAKLDLKSVLFGRLGKSLVDAIFGGIWDKIKGAGNWIKTHVFDKIYEFLTGKQYGFDSHSPAKTIIPLGKDIGEGLFSGIGDKLKDAGEWLRTNVFDKIHGGLNTAFGVVGGVASKIKDIGFAVINGFKSGADEQKPQLDTTASSINTDVQSKLGEGDWNSIGSKAINSINAGMSIARATIQATANAIQTGMYQALSAGDWGAIGRNIGSSLGAALSNAETTISSSAGTLASDMYNALNGKDWTSIGTNMLNGIWQGIQNGWNWLYNTVWDLAEDLWQAAKNALGIASPSKVFRDKIGEMIPAGIGVGIEANADSAISSVDSLSNKLVDTAKNMKLPPIAMGEVIPYNSNVQNDGAVTLKSVLDVLQSLETNAVRRDELEEILIRVFREYMNIDFYMGDEKLARHVKRGNSILDRRYNAVST